MSNLEQAIDSLGATANRIADERNQFKAQRDALISACYAALGALLIFDETEAVQAKIRAAIKLAEEE